MFHNSKRSLEPHKAIGETIRARRKELLLSIEDLTDRSGVDSGTISRAETGASQITLDTAVRLSRALELPLTDLAAVPTAEERRSNSVGDIYLPLPLTRQDIDKLVELYRLKRELAEDLVVSWLNTLAAQLAISSGGQAPLEFRDVYVQLLLLKHDLFQFKIKFPSSYTLQAVLAIYRFGGSVGRGEVQLLLRALSNNNELFQRLDRQSKDVLRRLQSHTPDRVKVSDLIKLESELGIDLIGLWERAEQLGKRDFESADADQDQQTSEARLISLFVTIVCWFMLLHTDDTDAFTSVRADLAAALRHGQLP
jgi:transcriptional regulator with XRE-family HTH domain